LRVLVTGAAGFVGYHVVRYLLEATDCEVVTLDRHISIHEDLWTNHVSYDLRQPLGPGISRLIGDVDAVVNLASSSDVPTFLRDPVTHTINNVGSTLHLLDWASGRKLRSFIQLSTNEVYGPANNHDTVEWSPLVPQTPYSASKAAQEMLTIGYWKTYDVPVVIVNTMHVFGEYQPTRRFIPTAVQRLLADQPVTIYGQKKYTNWQSASRQWTYAPDLAHGIHWLLTRDVARSSDGHSVPDRWNVVGTELSCLAVAQRAAERLGKTLSVDWQSWRTARPGYDMRYALDDTRLHRQGYTPLYGTTVGLERTVDWLQNREKK
jgi:dTDP-glucose 4,6-dehydratase